MRFFGRFNSLTRQIRNKKRFKKLVPSEERFIFIEVKGADHGFMCEERESFNKDASLIGWTLLMKELNK